MTNAEVYDGKKGRPDLVEAFFRMREEQYPNFKRPKSGLTGIVDGYLMALAGFAQGQCIRCLRFKPGDVVQSVETGKFGTVNGYKDSFMYDEQKDIFRKLWNGECSYDKLRVNFPSDDEMHVIKIDDLRDPQIPPELYDFVKAQLQSSCPLRDASCNA